MNVVADAVIKIAHAAIAQLRISERYGDAAAQDFRDEVIPKLFYYTLEKFDPDRGLQLSTLVTKHVKNHWLSFQNKLIKRLQREKPLETPLGEGQTLQDVIEDPRSLEFVSAQEAAGMYEEIFDALKDPRYQEIFRLWVDDTALNEELEILELPIVTKARNAAQKSQDIAQIINAKFPADPLSPVRINRVIHDIVKQEVYKRFPEEVAQVQVSPSKDIISTEEQLPPEEEEVAPVYRIDPETGERERIALNLRKCVTSSIEAHWFNSLIMPWLSLELNGKLKRFPSGH